MSDVPFFRGANRTDMFFAILLQNAVDWRTDQAVQDVAQQFGSTSVFAGTFEGEGLPGVYVVYCTDYVFVVSQSTQNAYQWIGNVLGSAAQRIPFVSGRVPAYFGLVAQKQYALWAPEVLPQLGNRKIVMMGFSLGAAAITIQKAILKGKEGIDCAAFVFGSPRPGDVDFETAFPTENFVRFMHNNDPIPSVPPDVWASAGSHSGWIPLPPLVSYGHVGQGYTVYSDYQIRAIDDLVPLADTILAFDTNLIRQFHNQGRYAKSVRGALPFPIMDGFQGYPLASQLDPLATVQLNNPFPWPWNQGATTPLLGGNSLIQVSIFIRIKGGSLGPTEQYYFPGDTPSSVYDAFQPTSPGNIFGLRTRFLSKSCEIYAFRASHVGTPRSSRLKKFTTPLVGTVNSSMTDIEDSITYFGYTADYAHKRQFHFRGIGENWILASELSPTGQSNTGLILTWLNKLSSMGLSMLIPAETQVRTFGTITKAAMADNVTLNLSSPVTIDGSAIVKVAGVRAFPLLAGQWLTGGTGNLASSTVVLAATAKFAPPTVLVGTFSVLSRKDAATNPITVFEFNGVSSKKTGRVSFLRRGRQSKKLSHR